jgi:hypothetical protein
VALSSSTSVGFDASFAVDGDTFGYSNLTLGMHGARAACTQETEAAWIQAIHSRRRALRRLLCRASGLAWQWCCGQTK